MTTNEILTYLQTIEDCKQISLKDVKEHKELIFAEKDNTEYYLGIDLYFIPLNSYGTHGFIAMDRDFLEILEHGARENFEDYDSWTEEEKDHQIELFNFTGISLANL